MPNHFFNNPGETNPRCRSLRCEFPVAQDRHVVAYREQLLQLMRDVNDRDPVGLKVRNDAKKRFGFSSRQSRGWFIHDQDAHVLRKSLCDFDDLLLPDAQVPDQGRRIQRLLESMQQFAGSLLLFSMLYDTVLCEFMGGKDVFRDVEIWEEVQFLVDYADSGAFGVSSRTEFHGRPIEEQTTGGGSIHARQDFHQCRLAGSVFADKDIDRAGVDGEVDLVKREGSRETFRDLLSDQNFSGRV